MQALLQPQEAQGSGPRRFWAQVCQVFMRVGGREVWLGVTCGGQGLGLWLKNKVWVQVCSGVSGCQAGVGTRMDAGVDKSVLP